jgi:hypothetical protein
MKLLSTVAVFFALSLGLRAQNVPLGQIVTVNGSSLLLTPLSPRAGFEPPPALQDSGLIVSVAPADASATFLYTSVVLTTSDGKKQMCRAAAAINQRAVYSSVLFNSGKLTVQSVQSVEVVTGTPTNFGESTSSEFAGECVVQ